jgi:hypothetical protein
MPTPILPSIIRGPAIATFGAYSFYFQGAISVKPSRPTWDPDSDMFGKLGPRAAGLPVWEISGTPVGELESLAKYFVRGPSNLVATNPVGSSLFTGAMVIHTKAGQTITFARAGIAKMPPLMLSPRKTAFGGMTFRAIGESNVQATETTWAKVLAASGFTDTGFDASKVITDIYSAALGGRGAPFDAMGAREGFEIEPELELEEVQDDNVGLADVLIASISCKCRFAPNNLTEAQIDELANWHGADAVLPGESLGKLAEDLVITGDSLVATLHRAGVVSSEHGYGVKVDRNGNVEFAATHSTTNGALNPLFSLALS